MTSRRNLRSTAYQWLHNLPLTRRLVAVVVLLALAAYLFTTSVTMMMMRGYLVERVDADLSAYIEPLAQNTVPQILGRTNRSSLEQQTFVPPNPYYVIFTPADESQPAMVPVFPFQPRGSSTPDLQRVGLDDERLGRHFTVPAVDDGSNWRMLAGRVSDTRTGEVAGTLTVGLPLTNVDSTVRQLAALTVVIGLTTMVAVGVLGWFAVRRAFRPLTRIEDTAAAIAAGDLTRRIPPRAARDEVGSLSQSLNRMLAQIEQAFVDREASGRRMRDFVADASHELRTPLATVKGYAELYRAGAVAPEDVGATMRRIEDEATRMTRLVEDLLTLTRLDSNVPMSPTRVDLTVLVSDVVQDARVRAPDRDVSFRSLPGSSRSAPIVVGEDGALRQVLTNLVANALTHTPNGTPVEVSVGIVDDRVVVEVCDHGPGLDAESARRVFERFYREDKSRSRASGGTGLGLAIASAIVARHDGSLSHKDTPGGGATFRVELPAAPPRGSAAT